MRRPAYVTLIAVLAIAMGMFSLLSKIYVLAVPDVRRMFFYLAESINDVALVPLPATVHISHGLIGSVVWITAGSFLLKARNWARWLMLFWGLLVLSLTFVTLGWSISLYLKTTTYLLMLIFLTTPAANSYFRNASHHRKTKISFKPGGKHGSLPEC